ncbi:MAG: hypothetical protein Q4P14_01950 [Methanobacteriaceae archaeon]|nr:hypothetical protein [Methanobacteriaceae archaeon]
MKNNKDNKNDDEEKLNDFKLMWSMGLGHSGKFFEGKNPIPKKTEIATKYTFKKIKKMPEQHVVVNLDIEITTEMIGTLKYGHIPEEMEDHWFMYCDEDTIRYYRSWTGICIYECKFIKSGYNYKLTELTINRDPNQYGEKDIEADIRLFIYLIVAELGGDGFKAFQEYLKIKKDTKTNENK